MSSFSLCLSVKCSVYYCFSLLNINAEICLVLLSLLSFYGSPSTSFFPHLVESFLDLFISLFTYLSLHLHIYLSIHPSIIIFIYICIYLSIDIFLLLFYNFKILLLLP